MSREELRNIWEKHIQEQQASGKSVRAWCKEHTLTEHCFYYWRKKLRLGKTNKKKQIQWFPLETKTSVTAITVQLGQARIEIPKDFDRHQLKQIIQVLRTI